MFKITALKNYTDKKPELIVKGNNNGNKIKEGDVYFVKDKERAKKIKESGFAKVEEVVEEVETAQAKVDTEKAVKKTRKKSK